MLPFLCLLEERCVFRRGYGSLTFDVPPMETSAWRAVVRVLRSPVDAVSCALLPSACTLCGSPLPLVSSAPICRACWSEIPQEQGPFCVRCGDVLDGAPSEEPATLCRNCTLAPPPFAEAASWATYDGRLRQMIHALKYNHLQPVADRLGKLLGCSIAGLQGMPHDILLIPVPLHGAKQRIRGFNQALKLAESAARMLRRSFPESSFTICSDAVARVRATGNQAGLTPRQRRINVRSAFAVTRKEAIAGRHLLIIDDIFTTGATARALSRELLRAGAASVRVATLARARLRNRVLSNFTSTPDQQPAQQPSDDHYQVSLHASTNQPSF